MRYDRRTRPFNNYAELEHPIGARDLARVTRGNGYARKCKKWALSHTNTYWYVSAPYSRR